MESLDDPVFVVVCSCVLVLDVVGVRIAVCHACPLDSSRTTRTIGVRELSTTLRQSKKQNKDRWLPSLESMQHATC